MAAHSVMLALAVASGAGIYGALASRTQERVASAGFWFEDVSFESPRLGGALDREDMAAIARIARAELTTAFAGLRVTLSERHDARYRVRVVQQLLDRRFRREVAVAGESRAVPGFGGAGAVSFFFLASGAVASAPEGADRAAIVAAIGRGLGRSAVHEFVHQLLPKAPIHDSRDVQSYEYASASRREQYYGEMRWDVARPLLLRTYGGLEVTSQNSQFTDCSAALSCGTEPRQDRPEGSREPPASVPFVTCDL